MPRASSRASLPRVLSATNARTPAPQSSRLTRAVPQLSPSVPPFFQVPHKIFVWDPNGVYLDYHFLNPVHGHFIEPSDLVGVHIQEILSRSNSRLLSQTLLGVWKFQEPQSTILRFQRDQCEYEAAVYCRPSKHGQIVGLVVDTCRHGKGSSRGGSTQLATFGSLPGNPRKKSMTMGGATLDCVRERVSLMAVLTPKEWQVARTFGSGQTNRQIADALHMSERGVKFHMANLLHKLYLPSRAHLAALRLCDSPLFGLSHPVGT